MGKSMVSCKFSLNPIHWTGGWPTPKNHGLRQLGLMKFPTEWKVIKFHGSKAPTKQPSVLKQISLIWVPASFPIISRSTRMHDSITNLSGSSGKKKTRNIYIETIARWYHPINRSCYINASNNGKNNDTTRIWFPVSPCSLLCMVHFVYTNRCLIGHPMGCLPPPSRIGCVSPRAVDGDLIPKRGIGLERWSKHPTRTIIIITIIIIIIIIINMVKKNKKKHWPNPFMSI